MTDEIDRAQETEAKYRDQALAAQAAHDSMLPVGFCYNCDEVVFVGCFCDSDCRDDYEYRESRIR
ncbi:MAG: hypothetical protein A2Y38_19120 [Spirochaetes bacterium GWB1_59_5]|nr:MAG: hypothetical protein A2Y38_19120 [Spirochaetes bacterium GWB1_59_5]